MSKRLVIYLNEQKKTTLSAAAVAVDEYVLTHKTVFPTLPRTTVTMSPSATAKVSSPPKEDRDCFYCHESGRVIPHCLALKRKEQAQSKSTWPSTKGVGFVGVKPSVTINTDCVDECFKPFLFDGFVSLNDNPGDQRPVRILQDTACSQTVMLSSILPFSNLSACSYNTELRGVEMGRMLKPIHKVCIKSRLVSGCFPVAVSAELPIRGVDVPLRNNVAGRKVTPALKVLDSPVVVETDRLDASYTPPLKITHLYPACTVTRSQA